MRVQRVVPVVVVVFLVALLAVWSSRRDPTSGSSVSAKTVSESGSATTRGLATAYQQAFPPDRPVPAWILRNTSKPKRIAGRVTLDGKPVANAVVTLQNMLTMAGHGNAVDVRTAADGRFDLGDWPGARYVISASSPETQAVIKQLDLADPKLAADTLELRLRTCVVRVSGTVTDASAVPIVEASVRREGVLVASTNAAGAYAVCVSFGEFELDYSADGYGAIVLGFDLLGSVTQDVVLVPSTSVTGHTVRAADGAPVPSAFVNVVPAEWGRSRAGARTVLSDAAGAFRVDGLTPGSFRVWAFADGMSAEDGVAVQAEVGVTRDVVVKLHDHAKISGVVTRADKPLAGVLVNAGRKSPPARARASVWTQGDGSFVLDDAPIGDLVFSVEGYEVTAPPTFRTESAKLYEGVKIEVALLARIHGTVTRQGAPVEGAMVMGANARVTSDMSGHYEIVGLPPGTYDLVSGSDDIGAFTMTPKVTVAAGENKRVDLELELAGEIAGTVVDAKGQPVPGVFVRWNHEVTQDEGRGTTDAQGHYRCRAMQGGGTYRALVFATNEAQKPFPPAPGTTYPTRDVKDGTSKVEGVTIVIDLQQMTISGRVVDSGGAPVADAQVKAMAFEGTGDAQFNTWQKLPMSVTDTDGTFTVRNLMAGTYALQARATDGAEQISPGIKAGATGVTIKLTRPASIEGTLAGFTQVPIVYATPWGGSSTSAQGTVDGTRFSITGLRPGRYVVNAQTNAEGDAKALDVRAAEKSSITLTAKGRGMVVGNVIDFKTRKPRPGAVCHAMMSVDGQNGGTNWDPAASPKSDESGRVLIDPAPAGSITVGCVMANGRHSQPSVDINLTPGGRAEVTLLSVELTATNPGTTGAGFSWQVTPPRVAQILPGSSAAKAGLTVGDLIVAVDGQPVDGLNGTGVQFLMDSHPVGSAFPVTYMRGTTRKTVSVQVQGRDL